MKKAQSISVNTMVVMAIGLIVLVLLVLLVGNYIRKLKTGSENCIAKGYECQARRCIDGYVQDIVSVCEDKTDVCCVKLLKDNKITGSSQNPNTN